MSIREELERTLVGSEQQEVLDQASELREAGEWTSTQGWCYCVIETDVPVKDNRMSNGRPGRLEGFAGWFPRIRAMRYAGKFKPLIPSYRVAVERRGFLHFEVVAYQNILHQSEPSRKEIRGVMRRLSRG